MDVSIVISCDALLYNSSPWALALSQFLW
jgi:hypothetical protein